MKRLKRLLILSAVLAVACAATFALTRYEEKQEQIRTSDAILFELPSDTVSALAWEYPAGDGLAFQKNDTGWIYTEDEAFPVSEEKILKILSHFESYGVAFIIENVEDYAQYGLDEPECTLHLTADDRSYTVKMGDFSKMDEQRYIDIGDGNVYLVSEDPMDYIDSSLSSMIAHDVTPAFERVTDIVFTGAEDYTIVHTDDSPDTYNSEDDIYFTARGEKNVPLDTSKVRKLLSTVTSLQLLDYVTYNATEEELKTYGLDAPELSVTVNYTYTTDTEETVADSCTLHISQNPEERAAADAAIAEGNTPGGVTKYVRLGDSKIVYILDDVNYGLLTKAAYDDLRHSELFWADFEAVTQIDVLLEDTEHTFTYAPEDAGDENADYVWFYKEETVSITALQTALTALSADSFTEELPTQKEEIGLTLHLDNENFPTVDIRLYRYDGSLCLAVVDGTPVSLVPRADVMALVEAIQAIVLS